MQHHIDLARSLAFSERQTEPSTVLKLKLPITRTSTCKDHVVSTVMLARTMASTGLLQLMLKPLSIYTIVVHQGKLHFFCMLQVSSKTEAPLNQDLNL